MEILHWIRDLLLYCLYYNILVGFIIILCRCRYESGSDDYHGDKVCISNSYELIFFSTTVYILYSVVSLRYCHLNINLWQCPPYFE